MALRDNDTSTNDRMRLMFFTPRDLAIPAVDRICIVRFCEAMAARGADVEAICLGIHPPQSDDRAQSQDMASMYGVQTPFRVTTLPNPARRGRNRINPVWRSAAYGSYAFWRLIVRRESRHWSPTILYVKNYLPALALVAIRRLLGKRAVVVFEAHVPPRGKMQAKILKAVDGVITVSRVLEEELTDDLGFEKARVITAHMGVDVAGLEAVRVSKAEARSRTALPQRELLVVYTGKVHSSSREIELLVETAALLPSNVHVVVVGGRVDHVEYWRRRVDAEGLANVRFAGFVAPSAVPMYQLAADCLVTYYPSHLSLNKYRASPGKLFEYMWAQRPIVAADHSALREALRPTSAVFVESDSPSALAQGIDQVLQDRSFGDRLARDAFEDVQEFTWSRRALKVERFVEALMGELAAGQGP